MTSVTDYPSDGFPPPDLIVGFNIPLPKLLDDMPHPDPHAAQDLVQEVYAKAYRFRAQYDPDRPFRTWIFTIARNRRIDLLRRDRRPEFDPNDPTLVREPDPLADDSLAAAQHERLLQGAVAQLPSEQAALVQLAFFEDKSHSIIAEELDLPLGTVKSRIRLAMAKLRTALRDLE